MSRNDMEIKEILNHAYRADKQAILTLTTTNDTSTGGDFGTVTEGDAISESEMRDVLLHNTGSFDCHYIAGTSAPTATRSSKILESGATMELTGIAFIFFAIITASDGNNTTVEFYALGVKGI